MHKNNFVDIQNETSKILKEMIIFIERISKEDNQEEQLKLNLDILKSEQNKLNELEFTFAVIGTMKAGKSTLINAIVGQEILPHRVEAMTILPTLVTHKKDVIKPTLYVPNKDVFNELSKKVNEKLDNKFKSEAFFEKYAGKENIFFVLKQLNDIMRKTKEVGIELPYEKFVSVEDFPRIEVEFFYLKDKEDLQNAKFSLLDTPGPNEYGHSEQLREISARQTKQASAVMLVVDYTQINGESSAQVKKQVIEALQYIGNDKTYILLNKFDEDRKQGKDNKRGKEGAIEYFAKEFLEDQLNNNIFPLSARDAFYANIGLQEIETNEKIDRNIKWIEEFAEIILGGYDEDDIDDELEDIDDIKRKSNKKLKKSFIEEPMKHIIDKSYDKSQFGAIESALQALEGVYKMINNLLKVQVDSYKDSINGLKQKIKLLKIDIERMIGISREIQHNIEKKIYYIDASLNQKAEEKIVEFSKYINDTFGKKLEEIKDDQKKQAENDITSKHRNKWNFLGNELLTNLKKNKIKEKNDEIEKAFKILLDEGEIEFSSEDDIKNFIQHIEKFIAQDLNTIQDDINDLSSTEISNFIEQLNKDIDYKLSDLIEDIKGSLGKDIILDIPKINLLQDKVKTGISVEAKKNEKIRTEDGEKPKDGTLAFLGRTFDIFDLGWGQEKKYKYINGRITKQDIIDDIEKASNTLKNELNQQIEKSFESQISQPITKSIENLKNEVERLRVSKEDVLKKREAEEIDTKEKISSVEKDIYFVKKQSKRVKNVRVKLQEEN